MSRLDSFIRRMCAQRDILNALGERLQGVEGAVYEFGLGNGRTFDHLCERFPDRPIVVFEREMRDGSPPVHPPHRLVLGDIRDTAAAFADGSAALVHADIDTGHALGDAELSAWLPTVVLRLLAPNGILVSSFPVTHPEMAPLPLPETVGRDRYYLGRRLPPPVPGGSAGA